MAEEECMSDSSVASDYGLLKKALPFDSAVPDNFDPNKAPETAEEYLQHAAYERSLMKPWITATIDPSKLTEANCTSFQEEDLNNSVSPKFLPTPEWQKEKLDQFIEFRKFIQRRIKSTSVNILDEKNFEDKLLNQSPNYSEIFHYSQADKIRVLELVIDHLDSLGAGTCFGFNVGCWIYTMLSVLDYPLFSEDYHVVRLLAKKCITIRSKYEETDKEKYHPLNLVICIVSNFYHQLDLSDS